MNDKIIIRLDSEEKEKIKKLLLLDKYNEFNISSLIRKLLKDEYKKNNKEIKEKIRELAFEEEKVELPNNKWSRNIEETIKIAKEDWVN